MENFDSEKYRRAKKKVEAIKGFYSHLKVFIIINIILFLLKTRVFRAIINRTDSIDIDFQNWMNWNISFTFILWALILIIHGLYVHSGKFKFLKKWEERKIRQLMEKDEDKFK